jgi:hypothetical protein
MQRFLAFLGSVAIGLVLTAVGVILDAHSILYAGIILLAFVGVGWLWSWSHPPQIAQPALLAIPVAETVPAATDNKGKALDSLRRARDSAAIAKSQRSDEIAARAFHELEAAMLSIKREFGISPLKVTSRSGDPIPYQNVLVAYISFVNRIYPLLREGHIEEASAKAKSFKWTWAQDE